MCIYMYMQSMLTPVDHTHGKFSINVDHIHRVSWFHVRFASLNYDDK